MLTHPFGQVLPQAGPEAAKFPAAIRVPSAAGWQPIAVGQEQGTADRRVGGGQTVMGIVGGAGKLNREEGRNEVMS
jgi:hypothetical protein